MKNLYIILSIIISTCIYSQSRKFIIIDKEYNKPIPYATVSFGSGKGTYSNEKGFFEIEYNINEVQISCIAYETTGFKLSEVKDTIKLSPKSNNLAELIIDAKKRKIIESGNFKNKSRQGMVFLSKSEYIVFLQPKGNEKDGLIKSVCFPLKLQRSESTIEEEEIKECVFKLNVYDSQKNSVSSQVIEIPKKEIDEKYNFINLDNPLVFAQEGLYFGIEFIGWKDYSDELLLNDEEHIFPYLMKFTETQAYNTYFRNPFDNNQWHLIRNNDPIFHIQMEKNFPFGMAFGLKLSLE